LGRFETYRNLNVPGRLALLPSGNLGLSIGRVFVTLLGKAPLIEASAFCDLNKAAAYLVLSPAAKTLIGSAKIPHSEPAA